MKNSDRTGSGDGEAPTEFPSRNEDEDPTELRSHDDGDETHTLLKGDDRLAGTDDSGLIDMPLGKASSEGGLPLSTAGDDGDDGDEQTRMRQRPHRSVDDADEDEPTQMRPDSAPRDVPVSVGPGGVAYIDEDDADEVTQLRSAVPAAVGIPEGSDESAAGSEEGERTEIRVGQRAADLDDDDLTRARVGGEEAPADDDQTAQMGTWLLPGDDDLTVQTVVRGDRPADKDDATLRASAHTADADNDPTLHAPAMAQLATVAADDDDLPAQDAEEEERVGGQSSTKPATAALGSGTVLKGRFVLEDKLGEGGMGGVYKAVDLVKQEARDRNPYVAVKVLNENFAEHPDAFIALQRESSRTQRLSHPSIASVYDFDRDGQTAYMVMELMQGGPLDKFLKKNRQGVGREKALEIIRDMAAALAYAHAQNLIHSDFKPGNIFITSSGAAKVFDFGIARAAVAPGEKAVKRGPLSEATLGKDDGTDKTLFDAGALGALTPAYAACEMFEGRDPAPQDDVYALGIVAYQLLTGRHPFERKKAPIAEAKNMVPQRPDGLTRREWHALKHALAFRRENRSPDAQVFLDEFFGVSGSGLRYALITATGMAAVIAGLYFGGVIGPGDAAIEIPRQWLELDTRIESARSGVEEQLATPVFSPVWEEFVRRDIRRWEESATPVIVAGTHGSEGDAEASRRQVFEQLGIPLRIQVPERSGSGYRLLAGPFGGEGADRQRADILQRLRGFGLDAVEESDAQAIAAARDQALGIYLEEIRRLMPEDERPRIPTIRDGDRFVADPVRLESARNQVNSIRSAQELLSRAIQRYPTRSERLDELSATLQDRRTRFQDQIDLAIATASSRQAEEDRTELLAQQRQQAERELQRAYEVMRDDRVFPAFAGRCHQPEEIQGVLAEFRQLQAVDQRQALDYASDCASSRVRRSPLEVLQSRGLILAVADHAGLAAIEAPDLCSSRTYIGNGRSIFCMDELVVGGNAPAVVVVPGNSRGIYGIGKYEVSVGEFNTFCEATRCGAPASGGARMPATGISADAAIRYTDWLSEQTGYNYRLPTEQEWLHAADANGSPLDSNRNCYSNVRGVVRGEGLVTVTHGAPNAWGMINHIGNAQEWVTTADNGLLAVGGKHSDPLGECNLRARTAHSGRADASTGFRVLREVR